MDSNLQSEVRLMCDFGISAECYNPQVLYIFNTVCKGITETRYHCHDFIELSILTEGQVLYKFDEESRIVGTGQILLFNPGVYHREYTDKNSSFNELHIGITNFKMQGYQKDFIPMKTSSPILTIEKYKNEFYKCCEEIINEQQRSGPGYYLIIKSLVMKLVIYIIREIQSEENITDCTTFSIESTEKSNIVHSIIEYINENYMRDISLDIIAKNMYLSPVYISKIFKEETGDSPINYLIKLRLATAHGLLKNKLPIKAVANEVGYSDAYYFSKLFKKYYGVPPSKIV